jgi:CD109 antigen
MDITISTHPNSYVGLLGVDQSVLLLKSGNDLSSSAIFDELAKYGTVDSFNKSNDAKYRDFFDGGAIIITNCKKPYGKKKKFS